MLTRHMKHSPTRCVSSHKQRCITLRMGWPLHMQGHSLRVPALCKEARSPERSPFCFWPRCTLLLSLVRRTCSSCPPLHFSRKPHATPRCSAARAGDALPFAARTGACICVLRLTTIPPTRQPLPCARARERERERRDCGKWCCATARLLLLASAVWSYSNAMRSCEVAAAAAAEICTGWRRARGCQKRHGKRSVLVYNSSFLPPRTVQLFFQATRSTTPFCFNLKKETGFAACTYVHSCYELNVSHYRILGCLLRVPIFFKYTDTHLKY